MLAQGVSPGTSASIEVLAPEGRHLWKAKSRALWIRFPRAHDFVGAWWAIGLVGCRPVRARSSAVDLARASCSRMLRLGSGLFASQTPLWASRAMVVSGLDRGPNQTVGPQLASRPFEAVPEPKRSGARPDCVMIRGFSGPSLAPRGRSRWATGGRPGAKPSVLSGGRPPGRWLVSWLPRLELDGHHDPPRL
jgi:hypothetical protein